jgi:hypothetical protein
MPVIPLALEPAARNDCLLLAATQTDVARRGQLLEVGLTAGTVDRMIDARRWQTDANGLVVVLHNGPLSQLQRESVAILAAGPVCALAARTAAARCGLVGWQSEDAITEVVVPRGTTYPDLRLVAVKVHESRRFTADDIHPSAWPLRVGVERALVDAACWSRRPRTACGVLAAGVQQKLTTATRLMPELELAGKVRFHRLLKKVLLDIEGGAQSVSEMDFIRFCARNGLPKPRHQAVRTDVKGRRRYLDAVLVGPAGEVRVEIDGALHLVVQTYWQDMSRGNDLVIARQDQLRFPSFVIYANDPEAVAQLKAALGLSAPDRQTAA